MKTRRLHFAAKLRQYRYLAKRIDKAVSDGTFRLLSASRQRQLLRRLKERLRRIAPILSERKMKNALAGMAMLLATGAGAQNFAAPVDSPFGLPQAEELVAFPHFVDIDDDGDDDLLDFRFIYQGPYDGRVMIFIENVGTPTDPVFAGEEAINPFDFDFGSGVEYTTGAFADLDNDGDFDFLVGMAGYGQETDVRYFENVGTPSAPSFTAPQVNPFGISSPFTYNLPAFADLDNDGDLDLYMTGAYGAHAFFENVGSPDSPSFGPAVDSPFGITLPFIVNGYAQFPAVADFDLDGDYDLLVGELSDNGGYYTADLIYFENEGTPEAAAFGEAQLNPFGLSGELTFPGSLAATDIDSDGDYDVMVADYDYDNTYIGKIVFYENLLDPSSIRNNELNAEITLLPNPVVEELNVQINSDEILTQPNYVINDVNGKRVAFGEIAQIDSNIFEQINVSEFSAGVYFLKIYTDEKMKTIRFLKQ